jgi:hypothetical protein
MESNRKYETKDEEAYGGLIAYIKVQQPRSLQSNASS